MAEPNQRSELNHRVPALDGLRGFAALFVMMYHFTMQVENARQLPTIVLKSVFSVGWSGVDLFFVLSGFLITSLLAGAKGSTNYFRVFYGRRMLRILPLYYAAIGLLFLVPVVVRLPEVAAFATPLKDQAWFWFYLQNYHSLGPRFAGLTGPLWSLAIEEQFYLVWPFVVWLTSTRQALWVCTASIALSLGYRVFAMTTVPHLDTYYVTQARLDGLSIGSAIALIATQQRWLADVKRLLPLFAIVSAELILIAGTDIRGPQNAVFPALYLAVAVLYGCVLVYAIDSRFRRLNSALESRVLGFFGRYSYALYVIHVPLMTILWHAGVTPQRLSLGNSDFVGALLYIVILSSLSTLLAMLSWHVLEKHFLKLKRHFVYNRASRNEEAPLSAAPLVIE